MIASHASRGPFIRKLSAFPLLDPRDLDILETLQMRELVHQAGAEILPEGSIPISAFVIIDGMACRQRDLADGGRQITNFLIPGDLCCADAFVGQAMDHAVCAVVTTRVGLIDRDVILGLVAEHPGIAATLWWGSLQEEALLREHIVALGRRNAKTRIAHLLCELQSRYTAVGLSSAGRVRLRLTQTRVADALGLTPVHVNRVLKQLHKANLIQIERGAITIQDVPELRRLADYGEGRPGASRPSDMARHALRHVEGAYGVEMGARQASRQTDLVLS